MASASRRRCRRPDRAPGGTVYKINLRGTQESSGNMGSTAIASDGHKPSRSIRCSYGMSSACCLLERAGKREGESRGFRMSSRSFTLGIAVLSKAGSGVEA